MADETLANLPAAGALDGNEIVPITQGGNTVRTTAQAIADLGGGGAAPIARVYCFSDGSIQTPSVGITSVTKNGTGSFTIDYTAAGFSTVPSGLAAPASSEGGAVGIRVDANNITETSCTITIVDGFGTSVDCGFTFVAVESATGGGGGGEGATPSATYVTGNDETSDLPNSKQLTSGVGVSVDLETPGRAILNAALVGGTDAGSQQTGSTSEVALSSFNVDAGFLRLSDFIRFTSVIVVGGGPAGGDCTLKFQFQDSDSEIAVMFERTIAIPLGSLVTVVLTSLLKVVEFNEDSPDYAGTQGSTFLHAYTDDGELLTTVCQRKPLFPAIYSGLNNNVDVMGQCSDNDMTMVSFFSALEISLHFPPLG